MYIDGNFRGWFDRYMVRKIILILVLFLTSCEPNITEEFKFQSKVTNYRFSRDKEGNYMTMDFTSYLTLSYSEDEGLTYFHLKEKIRNMSHDEHFDTKPYCTWIGLNPNVFGFAPEKNGKYYRDEQNDLNCEGVLNMTLEDVKKVKSYDLELKYGKYVWPRESGKWDQVVREKTRIPSRFSKKLKD